MPQQQLGRSCSQPAVAAAAAASKSCGETRTAGIAQGGCLRGRWQLAPPRSLPKFETSNHRSVFFSLQPPVFSWPAAAAAAAASSQQQPRLQPPQASCSNVEKKERNERERQEERNERILLCGETEVLFLAMLSGPPPFPPACERHSRAPHASCSNVEKKERHE